MHFGHFVHNTNHRHHRRVSDFGGWTVGRSTGGCLLLPQNSPDFHNPHPNHRHHRRVVSTIACTVDYSTGGSFCPPPTAIAAYISVSNN